jgi:hypothetical protein
VIPRSSSKPLISNDPAQKYLFATEAHNSVVWIIE